MRVLFTDGDTWDCLKAVRCVGRCADIGSFVYAKHGRPLAGYSRFVKGVIVHQGDDECSVEKIKEVVTEHSIDVLFPVCERSIDKVLRGYLQLESVVRMPGLPSYGSYCLARNKWEFYGFCISNGIPVPKTLLLTRANLGSRKLVEDFGLTFPIILKPVTNTGGGRGVALVSSVEQLVDLIDTLTEEEDFIVQEFVKGDDLCLCAYCRKGEIVEYTIQKAMQTLPGSFGPQRAMEFIIHSEVLEVCNLVVSSLEWEGLICIDLRQDGVQLKIIEVNPRLGQAVLGSLNSGVNLPQLACFDAMKIELPKMRYVPTPYVHPRASLSALPRFRGHALSGLKHIVADPRPEVQKMLVGPKFR